jgi:hypothetical protein
MDSLKPITDLSAVAALVIITLYLLRVWIPEQQKGFLAALEQKRADDLAAIERIQCDNRAARSEERSDFLAAMLQQRNDFLARDEARDASHGRHLDAQRVFFEHQSELERTACTAQMESIAQSVRNLAEIIVMQNAEERRRPDFGVKPKLSEGGGR